jgi:hypothetical protein
VKVSEVIFSLDGVYLWAVDDIKCIYGTSELCMIFVFVVDYRSWDSEDLEHLHE